MLSGSMHMFKSRTTRYGSPYAPGTKKGTRRAMIEGLELMRFKIKRSRLLLTLHQYLVNCNLYRQNEPKCIHLKLIYIKQKSQN